MFNLPLLLDGATGTELQKLGLPSNVCAEIFTMQNPDTIASVYTSYAKSGSHAVLACTFEANDICLSRHKIALGAKAINAFHINYAKHTLGSFTKVFGDMSSCGEFLFPLGDLDFDTLIAAYAHQAKCLQDSGADAIFIETIMDLQEARGILIACKSVCTIPIFVSMTYQNNKTLTGTPPECAIITLQSLGADAVGANCSAGPVEMVESIKCMKPYAQIPLIAKPNAGLPQLINGKTVFAMQPEEFAKGILALIQSGASIVGGCCGTTPLHIEQVCKILPSSVLPPSGSIENIICSRVKIANILHACVTTFALTPDFDQDDLADQALESEILCITGDVPPDTLKTAILELNSSTPLAFKLSPALLSIALTYYCGRALVYDGDDAICQQFGAINIKI